MSETETVPTFSECIAKGRDLLLEAYLQADLTRMERLEHLADSWINLAGLINMRDTSA